MIDEKKLIAEIREKIRPESFGEQCNSLDVIYAMLQLIDEQPKVGEWIPCSEWMSCNARLPIDWNYIRVAAWKEPSEPWEGGKE